MSRVQLGDARPLARELVGELGDASLQRVSTSAWTSRSSACDRASASVAAVNRRSLSSSRADSSASCRSAARHARRRAARRRRCSRRSARSASARRVRSPRRGRRRWPRRTPPRRRASRWPAKRSPSAVATTAVGWATARAMAASMLVDTHRPGEQRVEQPGDVGTVGRARADGSSRRPLSGDGAGATVADAAPSASTAPAVSDCAQRTQGARGVLGVVDDDARQRLTQRRFDRRLPAGVDARPGRAACRARRRGRPGGRRRRGRGPGRAPAAAPRRGPRRSTRPRPVPPAVGDSRRRARWRAPAVRCSAALDVVDERRLAAARWRRSRGATRRGPARSSAIRAASSTAPIAGPRAARARRVRRAVRRVRSSPRTSAMALAGRRRWAIGSIAASSSSRSRSNAASSASSAARSGLDGAQLGGRHVGELGGDSGPRRASSDATTPGVEQPVTIACHRRACARR